MVEAEVQEQVIKAQNGDSEAFGHIYDLYAQPIYNFLLNKIRHKQTTEDMVHTVFLKAWNNLKSYRPQTSAKFSTWLFQIANYTLIDYWRTRKETSDLEKVENLSAMAVEPKLYEDYEFLYSTLTELPLEYQTVLDLRFKQELNIKETAAIMNKSEVGIRVLQHRALKALEKKLIKNYPDELV